MGKHRIIIAGKARVQLLNHISFLSKVVSGLSLYFGGFLTLSNEGPPGKTTKSEKKRKMVV